jgi:murein L,D-transpeptidase YcbB/YkuD
MKWHLAVSLIFLSFASWAEEQDFPAAIREEIEQLRHTGMLSVGEVDVASGNLLAEVYERRGFTPAWSGVERLKSLLDLVEATTADGLDPEDYHFSKLVHAHELLVNGRELNLRERAALDIGMTDSLIRLAYHQRFGKVEPQQLDANWNFSRDLDGQDPATVIQRAIDAPSLIDFRDAIFPRVELYRRLQTALADYRRLAAAGGWPEVPAGPTLKPGSADDRLKILAQRLAVTGDLSEGARTDYSVYGAELEVAVKRFQRRHGLDADGVVGPATLRALNVPAEKRIEQIRVNLERGRWVLAELESDFVVVNIASFKAFVFRGNQMQWSTRVVVGRTYRKTPVFRSEMKYVVFNPTWTVPYSIATKDILPQIQRDPSYLTTKNFIVRDRNGQIVDPAGVDWHSLSRSAFPYTLVQQPGQSNALGEIKFMFPNEHGVYLHDTPSKELFGRAERTFSSGCVRVERPFDFAEQLLALDGWDAERVAAARRSGETSTVFLSKPLPVLLLYWTTEVDDDGQVFFYEDVYDRDQAVLRALDSSFRFNLPEA